MNDLLLGTDISEHDSPVSSPFNWQVGRARGLSWASIRISQGQLADSAGKVNYANAVGAGALPVVYHWLDPRIRKAQTQIDIFLKQYQGGTPMIDLEDVNKNRIFGFAGIDQVLITPWLLSVEKATGIRPWIYLNQDYWQRYLYNPTPDRYWWLSNYPLFIAAWASAPPKANLSAPACPPPWSPMVWEAWQFTAYAPGNYYGFTAAKACCLQHWKRDQ
jgi:GH25 family lysozyme M1 (1,4-beta-N-acetylmuramidase)